MQLKLPKRLQRPETPPAFSLTERDRDLVRLVSDFRFASSDQLYRFLAIANPTTSRQKVRRRLQALFSARYLTRPTTQHVQLGGLAPLVYCIDTAGLKLLGQSDEPRDARTLWAAKASRTASPLFLDHALGTTECMLAFAHACAARGGTNFIDQPHVIEERFPAETRALKHPLRLRVSLKDGVKTVTVSVVPDRLFAIDSPDGRRFFALEWDTGSMAIAARRLTKSSFGKKLRAYLAAYDEQRFQTQWGLERLRVLTVTSSEARIRAMLDAQRDITKGRLAGMFLYAARAALAEHGPLAPIWITSDSTCVSLLPEA